MDVLVFFGRDEFADVFDDEVTFLDAFFQVKAPTSFTRVTNRRLRIQLTLEP
jgi:hypothetical protein